MAKQTYIGWQKKNQLEIQTHLKTGVNSGAPEGYTVHPPLVRQVVLHINDTSILVETSVRNKIKNKDKNTTLSEDFHNPIANKGNNKITEHRAIFQRERQNSYVNKQTKSVNNRKTGKTAMAPDLVQAFPKKWWVRR